MRQIAALLLGFSLPALSDAAVSRPLNATSFLQRRAADAAEVPIVTGCQELCGVRDQACTTSCQVCVEQWSCKTVLEDCEACLQHTKLTKRTAALSSAGHIFDSGGTSMVRDGIKTELEGAEVKEYHSRRELRQSRSRVLEAQRQAEWASQERAEETRELKEAKLAFERSRDDVKKWRVRSAKKLKAMRAKRETLRERKEEAQKDQAAAEDRLQEAEKELERKDGDTEANEAEVEKQRQQVKENHKKAEETEEALDRQKKDAEWLDRGLKEDVDRSKRGLKAAMTNLRMANAAEIAARYNLEEAKKHYLDAADDAKRSQKAVRRLQADLDNSTLHEQLLNESLGIEKKQRRVEKKEKKKKKSNSKSGDDESEDANEDASSDDKLEDAPKLETKDSDEEKEDEKDEDAEEATILNAEKEGQEDAEKEDEEEREKTEKVREEEKSDDDAED